MKNLLFTFLFCFLLSASTFAQRSINGKIVEIKDARTFVIEGNPKQFLTARLQYIEVPENGQPLYEVVKTHFAKLVLNKIARLEIRRTSLDNVLIGKLFIDETDISLQLLRDGAAWYDAPEIASHNPNESQTYRETELTAKTEKRGVWSIPNMLPAWEFRTEKEVKAQKEIAENQTKQEKIQAEKQRIKDEKAAKELSEIKMPTIADVDVNYTQKTSQPIARIRNNKSQESQESEEENLPEKFNKEILDGLLRVIQLDSGLIVELKDAVKNKKKFPEYKGLVYFTDEIDRRLSRISGNLRNKKNISLVNDIQKYLSDVKQIYYFEGKNDLIPYDKEIVPYSVKYKVNPSVAVNGEKIILRSDLLVSALALAKINFDALRLSLSKN